MKNVYYNIQDIQNNISDKNFMTIIYLNNLKI